MTLPNFIIVGERRAGTTNLANLIEQHPDIFVLPKRDGGYFIDPAFRTGEGDGPPDGLDRSDWARRFDFSAYERLFDSVSGETAIGEKSADYLFLASCHALMAERLPGCRFVVTLRNPVNRAWSHYWNEVGKGREPLDFEAALAAEEERSGESAYALNHLSYGARGHYGQSLARFTETVSPERVHVVVLEHLLAEPDVAYPALFAFLGVDPAFRPLAGSAETNANWTTIPRDWARDGAGRIVRRIVETGAQAVSSILPVKKYRRRRARAWLATPVRRRAAGLSMPPGVRASLVRRYAGVVDDLRPVAPDAAEAAARYWTERA